MKILLTGSNGLIGSSIVRMANEMYLWPVVACSQSYNKLPLTEGNVFELCDITNGAMVNYIIEKHKPDAVIHTAALSKPDYCEQNREDCWKINVLSVDALAKKCHSLQIPLLYLSSDFIYDGLKGHYSELDLPNPCCFYGESKAEGERIVLSYSNNISVRTSLVYGWPADPSKGNILSWVVSSLRANKQIRVVGDQFRAPTFADDLAQGCLEIIHRKKAGVYNLCGYETSSVYDFAKQIARCFGLYEGLLLPVDTISLNEPARRPLKTGLAISKAIIELNFSPKSIHEGLYVLKDREHRAF